jgi:catechol 2,3-dioxygenase-like lactoylglutathione lyase family enzyme
MAMATVRINHVSIHATDLAASVAFYEGLLDARQVPTLDFGFPVQWLDVGDTHLHLFEKPVAPPSHHHFAVTVDDLAPVYAWAAEHDAFDGEAFGHHLFRLPGDVAQLYLRDPAGNLLEIDAPGADALPADVREEMRIFEEVRPQTEENLRARLPVTP